MPVERITSIYQSYRLMPTLQQHQLRVAAVAKSIIDQLSTPKRSFDPTDVITTCLLHDMGNIIKFDLTAFPDFYQSEGLEHWQQIKQQYIQKYGSDEHQATLQIAKELGVHSQVTSYIDAVGFTKAEANLATTDLGQKICAYADMRVGPHGVISLQHRFSDLRNRYGQRYAGSSHKADRQVFEQAILKVEAQIQSSTQRDLQTITDHTISGTIEALQTWELTVPDTWNPDL